tara:strand:+ start:98 stop:367 length:270 start_codon:yes stop_codon:yes gene_type:complete
VSAKTIRKQEKIYSKENVVGFKKDKSTGLYHLVTQEVTRETVSGDIKCKPKKESEDLYELSTEDDYEYLFEYEDIDGKKNKIYFRKIHN